MYIQVEAKFKVNRWMNGKSVPIGWDRDKPFTEEDLENYLQKLEDEYGDDIESWDDRHDTRAVLFQKPYSAGLRYDNNGEFLNEHIRWIYNNKEGYREEDVIGGTIKCEFYDHGRGPNSVEEVIEELDKMSYWLQTEISGTIKLLSGPALTRTDYLTQKTYEVVNYKSKKGEDND